MEKKENWGGKGVGEEKYWKGKMVLKMVGKY